MITALAWTSLIVFVLWCLFSGLPDYLKAHEAEQVKRDKKRFKKVANGHTNGYGKLSEDDLAELDGMFGEAGSRPEDYK